MERTVAIASAALGLAVAAGAVGCHEEGPAERAGRKLDELVEQLGDEGPMEKAGRQLDEAVEDAKESARKHLDAD